MASLMQEAIFALLRRQADDPDVEDDDQPEASTKERFSSWALFILIMLMITALFTSYLLQQKKIQAVHETVLSIFAGMIVGLTIKLFDGHWIQNILTFDYQVFFNLLLPPIILASGYELHQANFFRNIGAILTFAFAGTFISAIVLGLIIYLYTRIPFEGLDISFVEAISVGATLSATDPVTILAIFTTYKVDPKLYTIIFGESILNDAIAIVLFETAQKYKPGSGSEGNLSIIKLFEAAGVFTLVFFGSLVIGLIVGVATALMLKYTMVRRYPKIESCLVILIAYASYFFSNGCGMSGIVSLLFCGITLKHYAYYNMSRRTQLTTKYLFQVFAQLTENFIFIYLGLTLFTSRTIKFQPLLILVTTVGICCARWAAVFPLSRAINWIIRYRAKRKGLDVADELPYSYQAMLFWAGLRGAVGVALAAGLSGANAPALQATVLVVVVLTVIIFGGTTARMLEILGIKTGVVEEIDSDDEFDIETATGGTYYNRAGTGFGHRPRPDDHAVALSPVDIRSKGQNGDSYSSGNASPPVRPHSGMAARTNSNTQGKIDSARHNLLGRRSSISSTDTELSDSSDLPPAANHRRKLSARGIPAQTATGPSPYPTSGHASTGDGGDNHMTASGAIRELFTGTTEDHAAWFRQLDEDYIKPKLLLDQGKPSGGGGGSGV